MYGAPLSSVPTSMHARDVLALDLAPRRAPRAGSGRRPRGSRRRLGQQELDARRARRAAGACAATTTPMPPAPSTRSTRYLPASTVPSRRSGPAGAWLWGDHVTAPQPFDRPCGPSDHRGTSLHPNAHTLTWPIRSHNRVEWGLPGAIALCPLPKARSVAPSASKGPPRRLRRGRAAEGGYRWLGKAKTLNKCDRYWGASSTSTLRENPDSRRHPSKAI